MTNAPKALASLILAVAFLSPSTTQAQDISPHAAALADTVNSPPPFCESTVSTAPTAIGVSVSSLGFLGGVVMLGGGAWTLDGNRNTQQKGLMAGGAVLMAASVAGIVTSAIYLHRAKAKKAKQLNNCRLVQNEVPRF